MTCQPRIGIRACSRIFSWMSSSDRSRDDLHIHVAHLADEAVYDIPAQELLHAAALGVAQDHVGDAVVLGEADELTRYVAPIEGNDFGAEFACKGEVLGDLALGGSGDLLGCLTGSLDLDDVPVSVHAAGYPAATADQALHVRLGAYGDHHSLRLSGLDTVRAAPRSVATVQGEPTSGLEPLSSSHYELEFMRCRGLHRFAIPPYLGRFPFCVLPCVAPYCVPGGVRVVSEVRGLPCRPFAARIRSAP